MQCRTILSYAFLIACALIASPLVFYLVGSVIKSLAVAASASPTKFDSQRGASPFRACESYRLLLDVVTVHRGNVQALRVGNEGSIVEEGAIVVANTKVHFISKDGAVNNMVVDAHFSILDVS